MFRQLCSNLFSEESDNTFIFSLYWQWNLKNGIQSFTRWQMIKPSYLCFIHLRTFFPMSPNKRVSSATPWNTTEPLWVSCNHMLSFPWFHNQFETVWAISVTFSASQTLLTVRINACEMMHSIPKFYSLKYIIIRVVLLCLPLHLSFPFYLL